MTSGRLVSVVLEQSAEALVANDLTLRRERQDLGFLERVEGAIIDPDPDSLRENVSRIR
jgi:hypothetical protein